MDGKTEAPGARPGEQLEDALEVLRDIVALDEGAATGRPGLWQDIVDGAKAVLAEAGQ